MKCIIFFSLLMHLDYLNAQVPHRINIGQNSDKKQNISLNSIASSISYVPLETTKECLLENDILRLEFFEDHLYLCDGRFIYVFTKNGKFQKKIGKQGKGPGEYGKVITDFLLDKQAKTITVFDIMKKSFIVYDIAGTFIREYKSDFISGPMASLNDKSFISYNTGFIYDKSAAWYDLFSMTKAGKTGKGYIFNKQKKQKYGLNIYPAIFYYHQNKLLYKNPYEEIIFMIEDQKKIPIYVFDLGRYQQSKDEADVKVKVDRNKNVRTLSNPAAKEKLSVYRLCESESYLFVEYHINNRHYIQ